jgi:hypothetical protein
VPPFFWKATVNLPPDDPIERSYDAMNLASYQDLRGNKLTSPKKL